MKPRPSILPILGTLLWLLAACASSDVTSQSNEGSAEAIAKPERIIVYDFVGSPDDLPVNSAVVGHYAEREVPQSPEEVELGRRLGAAVADKLVENIVALGMPAERVGPGPAPDIGNIVIGGQFVSIDEGSRLKRMLIGFGAGAAELKTFVEGYLVTANGLRPLGSREIASKGGKMPGILVPVGVGAATGSAASSAVIAGTANVMQEFGPEGIDAAAKRTADTIAAELETVFKQRGWI